MLSLLQHSLLDQRDELLAMQLYLTLKNAYFPCYSQETYKHGASWTAIFFPDPHRIPASSGFITR